MNSLFISVVLSFITLAVNAQVSYGDLAFGSYNMKINLITENDSIFLHVNILMRNALSAMILSCYSD